MSGSRYIPSGNEQQIFSAAYESGVPVLLKGPTGCGKTRLVEAMAELFGRPVITVMCHEDLTAADLIGRFLLKGSETVWQDGPVTRAARDGAICYLDEVVEARADTLSVIHALTDHRRTLFVDRLNEEVVAQPGFGLVVSYNPGYQTVLKDLKPSLRQRMVALDMTYPRPEVERQIVVAETGVDEEIADRLVAFAVAVRRQDDLEIAEVASTRSLISAAHLIRRGVHPADAVKHGVVQALADDKRVLQGVMAICDAVFSSAAAASG